MGVLVLECGCGQQVKAPGATPGRVGRCPKCGSPLKVPDVETAADNAPGRGYLSEPSPRSERKERSSRVADGAPTRRDSGTPGGPNVLFPLRGAESLMVVAAMGIAFWVFAVLVPEYCLSVLRDAEAMGTPSMGRLVAVISAMPAVILMMPVLFYALQYLGRVLVSSAQGEERPPRPPDRNFDGFLNGLSPWLLWLFGGASVGALPLAAYWFSRGDGAPVNLLVLVGLGLLGLPYALMALMMIFLHDDAFAAKPVAVVTTVARLGFSFFAVCLVVATAFGLVWAAFAGTLALRESYFWLYIVVALGCWLLAHWVAIVVMRVLGVYYYSRRKLLRWHRKRPRWGVNWGI